MQDRIKDGVERPSFYVQDKAKETRLQILAECTNL